MSATPPRPIPALHVGTFSLEGLAPAELAGVREAATDLLARIRAAADAAVASEAAEAFPLLAGEACTLRCVSFSAERSEDPVREAAAALGYEIAIMLRSAAQAPPDTGAEQALGDGTPAIFDLNETRSGTAATRHVSELLIEQSDFMVVVRDAIGEDEHDPAHEVVRKALDRRIPVAMIGGNAPHSVRLLNGAHEKEPAPTLEAVVGGLLLLPKGAPAARRDAALYFSENGGSADWAARLVAAFEGAINFGSALPRPTYPPQAPSPEPLAPALDRISALIDPHFAAADRFAIRYAALYRLSSTARYLAVLPMTLGVVLMAYGPALVIRQFGGALQLFSISGVLFLFWLDRRAGWHRRFLDYRFLAEHLRQSRLLALLGSTDALPQLPIFYASAASEWVDWQIRRVARALGLVPARLTPEYIASVSALLTADLEGQIAFYSARALRLQGLAKRLRIIGTTLFASGIVLTAIRAAFENEAVSNETRNFVQQMRLLIPSLAPVFFGLLSQNEYGRLSQRYAAMAQQLRRMLDDLRRQPHNAARVDQTLRDTTAVLLSEVSDWRILIKARAISPF